MLANQAAVDKTSPSRLLLQEASPARAQGQQMLLSLPMHVYPAAGESGYSTDFAGNRLHSRPQMQQPGMPSGCGDIKPRLTKDQHEFLEKEFQKHNKPTTMIKRGYAESLHVPIEKINNWFQNRRAKVKQDAKKLGFSPLSAMAPPAAKKQTKASRMPYMADHAHQFSSTPNLLQSSSKTDIKGPYSSGRHASSQINLPLDFGGSSLQSISESANHATPDTLADSLAAGGYNLPLHISASEDNLLNPGNMPGIPDMSNGLDQSFNLPETSALYNTNFSNDSAFAMSNYSNSASASTNNLGAFASATDLSCISTTQSTDPLFCSTGPNAMSNIITNLHDWTEGSQSPATFASGSQHEGSIEGSASHFGPLDSASPQDMPIWSAGPTPDPAGFLTAHGMYLHSDLSSQSLLAGVAEHSDSLNARASPMSSFDRRPSSVSVFAESSTGEPMQITDFKTERSSSAPRRLSDLPSSIASRRQRPRPAALGSAALRTSSYSSAMPASPGSSHSVDPEQSLRRVRSGGVNSSRIQKPGIASAQRSPLAMNFSEVPAANVSSAAPGTAAPGKTLAPPTPMTPSGHGFGNAFGTEMAMSQDYSTEQVLPEDMSVSWNFDFGASANQSAESPPYTPMDKIRLGSTHSRVNSGSLWSEAPPQSAPATQQVFGGPPFAPYNRGLGGTLLTSGLASGSMPRQQHTRSPSMPISSVSNSMETPTAFAISAMEDDLTFSYMDQPKHHSRGASDLSGLMPQNGKVASHSTSSLSNSMNAADFEIHEYTPPQGSAQASSPQRVPEQQPKIFTFSNQSLKDFQSD